MVKAEKKRSQALRHEPAPADQTRMLAPPKQARNLRDQWVAVVQRNRRLRRQPIAASTRVVHVQLAAPVVRMHRACRTSAPLNVSRTTDV